MIGYFLKYFFEFLSFGVLPRHLKDLWSYKTPKNSTGADAFNCICLPNCLKTRFAILGPILLEPGIRKVKNGISEKKAVQKWGQNRNPCLLKSFRDHVSFFKKQGRGGQTGRGAGEGSRGAAPLWNSVEFYRSSMDFYRISMVF